MKPPSSRPAPVPIGKYFVEAGRINGAQLERALDHKHEKGGKLGQALVSLGYVSETEVVEALRQQGKVHCINLRPEVIDTQVALEFGEGRSRKFRAVAVNRIAGFITVAMEDPADVYAIDAMSMQVGARIWPVYAEPRKIEQSIDYVFSARVSAGSISQLELGATLSLGTRSSKKTLQAPAPAPAQKPSPPDSPPPPPPVTLHEAPASAPSPTAPTAPAATISIDDSPAPRAEADAPTPVPATPIHEVEDKPTKNLIKSTLQEAFLQGASDVHLEPAAGALVIRYRVDGMLFDRARLDPDFGPGMLNGLKAMAGISPEPSSLPQEGRSRFGYKGRSIELRIATLPSMHGEEAIISILEVERETRSLDELDLEREQLDELERVIRSRDGLILVAGPANSGRTTTQYAILERLNTRQRKIVTLEDPPWRLIDGVTQINVQPQCGLTCAKGLETVLRMDVDVVMVDEIRNEETASLVADGAHAGRLMLSSLHTTGAVESLTRLMDLGVDAHVVADTLKVVVAQRLLRRVCSHCSQATTVDASTAETLGIDPFQADGFVRGAGCEKCFDTGFRGRQAVFEVMPMSATMRELLRNGASSGEIHRAAHESGIATIEEVSVRKALAGATSPEEVLRASNRS